MYITFLLSFLNIYPKDNQVSIYKHKFEEISANLRPDKFLETVWCEIKTAHHYHHQNYSNYFQKLHLQMANFLFETDCHHVLNS